MEEENRRKIFCVVGSAGVLFYCVRIIYTDTCFIILQQGGKHRMEEVTVSSDEKKYTAVPYRTIQYSTAVQKRETIKNNNGGDFVLLLLVLG